MQRIPAEPVAIGDVLEVVGHRIGDHAKFAEVVEVIGDPRTARYRVRWDDGRETIVYPSSDVVVHRRREPVAAAGTRRA
jgi:hypothetical protein